MYSATLISEPEYKIDVPGFEHLAFSASSKEALALPAAVKFCTEKGGVLQSAREAVAVRLAMNGQDFADNYQVTRTAVIYFKSGNDFFVAFDDDAKQNILLEKSQEGYDSHSKNNKWLVPKSTVNTMIDRAEKNDRVVPALDSTLELRLDNGTYEKNAAVRAILGDVAAPYAKWLQEKGYKNGYVWTLSPVDCEKIGVTHKTTEIRRVGLGVGGFGIGNYLGAYDLCYNYGRARRVRENFQRK